MLKNRSMWPIDLKAAASPNANIFPFSNAYEQKRVLDYLSFQCKHVTKMKSKRTFMAISVSMAVCEKVHLLLKERSIQMQISSPHYKKAKLVPLKTSCCTSKTGLSVIVSQAFELRDHSLSLCLYLFINTKWRLFEEKLWWSSFNLYQHSIQTWKWIVPAVICILFGNMRFQSVWMLDRTT